MRGTRSCPCGPLTRPPSRVGVGTRKPSVPPVTQKNLKREAPQHLRQRQGQDAEEDPGVAHADQPEDGRDQHRGQNPPMRNSSIDVTRRYFTMKATA